MKIKKLPDVKKYLIVFSILLFLFLFFSKLFVLLLLMLACIFMSYFIGALSMRFLGIELVTFTSVLAGIIAGPIIGLWVALILIVFHLFINKMMNVYVLWVVPTYCLMAVAAGLLKGADVTTLGIWLTFIANAFFLIMAAVTEAKSLANHIPWSIIDVIQNVFLFTYVAPLLLSML